MTMTLPYNNRNTRPPLQVEETAVDFYVKSKTSPPIIATADAILPSTSPAMVNGNTSVKKKKKRKVIRVVKRVRRRLPGEPAPAADSPRISRQVVDKETFEMLVSREQQKRGRSVECAVRGGAIIASAGNNKRRGVPSLKAKLDQISTLAPNGRGTASLKSTPEATRDKRLSVVPVKNYNYNNISTQPTNKTITKQRSKSQPRRIMNHPTQPPPPPPRRRAPPAQTRTPTLEPPLFTLSNNIAMAAAAMNVRKAQLAMSATNISKDDPTNSNQQQSRRLQAPHQLQQLQTQAAVHTATMPRGKSLGPRRSKEQGTTAAAAALEKTSKNTRKPPARTRSQSLEAHSTKNQSLTRIQQQSQTLNNNEQRNKEQRSTEQRKKGDGTMDAAAVALKHTSKFQRKPPARTRSKSLEPPSTKQSSTRIQQEYQRNNKEQGNQEEQRTTKSAATDRSSKNTRRPPVQTRSKSLEPPFTNQSSTRVQQEHSQQRLQQNNNEQRKEAGTTTANTAKCDPATKNTRRPPVRTRSKSLEPPLSNQSSTRVQHEHSQQRLNQNNNEQHNTASRGTSLDRRRRGSMVSYAAAALERRVMAIKDGSLSPPQRIKPATTTTLRAIVPFAKAVASNRHETTMPGSLLLNLESMHSDATAKANNHSSEQIIRSLSSLPVQVKDVQQPLRHTKRLVRRQSVPARRRISPNDKEESSSPGATRLKTRVARRPTIQPFGGLSTMSKCTTATTSNSAAVSAKPLTMKRGLEGLTAKIVGVDKEVAITLKESFVTPGVNEEVELRSEQQLRANTTAQTPHSKQLDGEPAIIQSFDSSKELFGSYAPTGHNRTKSEQILPSGRVAGGSSFISKAASDSCYFEAVGRDSSSSPSAIPHLSVDYVQGANVHTMLGTKPAGRRSTGRVARRRSTPVVPTYATMPLPGISHEFLRNNSTNAARRRFSAMNPHGHATEPVNANLLVQAKDRLSMTALGSNDACPVQTRKVARPIVSAPKEAASASLAGITHVKNDLNFLKPMEDAAHRDSTFTNKHGIFNGLVQKHTEKQGNSIIFLPHVDVNSTPSDENIACRTRPASYAAQWHCYSCQSVVLAAATNRRPWPVESNDSTPSCSTCSAESSESSSSTASVSFYRKYFDAHRVDYRASNPLRVDALGDVSMCDTNANPHQTLSSTLSTSRVESIRNTLSLHDRLQMFEAAAGGPAVAIAYKERMHANAAIKIQSMVRTFLAELRFRIYKMEHKLADIEQKKQNELKLIQMAKCEIINEMFEKEEALLASPVPKKKPISMNRLIIADLERENAALCEDTNKLTEMTNAVTSLNEMIAQNMQIHRTSFGTLSNAVGTLTERNDMLERKVQKYEERIDQRSTELVEMRARIDYDTTVRKITEKAMLDLVHCIESRSDDNAFVERILALADGDDIDDLSSSESIDVRDLAKDTTPEQKEKSPKNRGGTEGFELSFRVIGLDEDDVSLLGDSLHETAADHLPPLPEGCEWEIEYDEITVDDEDASDSSGSGSFRDDASSIYVPTNSIIL
jgi:hypothetical protein